MKLFFQKLLGILIILCIFGAGFLVHTLNKQHNLNVTCAFCSPEVLQTHMFYEDKLVRGLCTYKPIEPGHCLIIPKRHIQQFEQATPEEISAMGNLIKKVNIAIQKINGPSAYLLLQKNGPEVGQTVPHLHFHYIPRKIIPGSCGPISLLLKFIIETFQSPIPATELAQWVTVINKTIAEEAQSQQVLG